MERTFIKSELKAVTKSALAKESKQFKESVKALVLGAAQEGKWSVKIHQLNCADFPQRFFEKEKDKYIKFIKEVFPDITITQTTEQLQPEGAIRSDEYDVLVLSWDN